MKTSTTIGESSMASLTLTTGMLLASMIVLATTHLSVAQAPVLAPVYDTPIYDPQAKRYFALINARYSGHGELPWSSADEEARKRIYKGVHGRLAVVDGIEVHEFLMRTFRPSVEAWIGLRYWCNSHKLEWSNGQFVEPGSFNAWASEWNQDAFTCKSAALPNYTEQFAPVAYTGVPGFRWIAKGWTKHYYEYFIEFPTGQP